MNLKDKKIFITGGSGFLGTYLTNLLKKNGYTDIESSSSKDYDLMELEDIKSICYNRPDIILHLAAKVGGIGANAVNAGSFFYQNLFMGTNLMHYAMENGVGKFLSLATICAYPKFTPVPFKESDIWNGYPEETNAPYGLAKKMLLVQSQAYRQQYGFNAVCLAPVNLYGPNDSLDVKTSHVIPGMCIKFIKARQQKISNVILWGDGSPTREFLHVQDCARGIMLAMERYDKSELVNLGSGQEISMLDLANQIKELTHYTGNIIWNVSEPNGQPKRRLDTSKAKQEFGFEALIDFKVGLKETVEWYEKVLV